MPTYETLFITLPNLSDEDERAAVSALSQLVSERGVLVANERMGRRRLAYPIKKCEDGVYTRLLYDADESVPRELERRLRISDKVLRHLTVRLEEDWAVAAKEQAVRDAAARAEAEAARAAAAAAGIEAPGPAQPAADREILAPAEHRNEEGEGAEEPPSDEPAEEDRG